MTVTVRKLPAVILSIGCEPISEEE